MVLTETQTQQTMGVQLTMGALTLIASHGDKRIGAGSASQLKMIEGNGFGIKYDMGGGMTIAASTMEAEDDKDETAAGGEKKNIQQILVKLFTLLHQVLKLKLHILIMIIKMVVKLQHL